MKLWPIVKVMVDLTGQRTLTKISPHSGTFIYLFIIYIMRSYIKMFKSKAKDN